MCGIIGYSGNLDAKKILINGLTSLEYRGYDSAGISFFDSNGKINTIKQIGKVEKLKELLKSNKSSTNCGIGHTRWATHGGVTNENAHPHSCKNVCLVHNGIIENYLELINEYNIKDSDRNSSTDSEIVAILLNKFYEENNHDPLVSIQKVSNIIKGTYSFCIMFTDRPNEIFLLRKVSPLVITNTEIGSFVASDLTALIPYSKEYFIVPEEVIVKLRAYDIKVYDLNSFDLVNLDAQTINWSVDSAEKSGYPHYMIKEINEQPEAIKNTVMPYIVDGIPNFDSIHLTDDVIKEIDNIQIVACGTARHAGLVVANVFSPILQTQLNTLVASEFRYSDPYINKNTLFICISQSGETVDTLASLNLANQFDAKTLAVVNVQGSSIAREAKYQLYTNAGPEIAVASTKAYTVQIAILYLLFARIAYVKNKMTLDELRSFTNILLTIPEIIQDTISKDKTIKQVAKFLKFKDDCYYIGRLQDYISSLEGALKLKEISYIHTDAYAAGELKHGTIALINDGVPVIAIDTNEKISSKLLSNVQEVKARNASVILIINEKFEYNKDLADFVITIKDINSKFAVFPVSIITQLIAYYTSLEKGLDVDKPRNLAKSVTVE